MGLSFNINSQSGLKLHSEVVLPDDDSLKPALYQDLVGNLVVGFFVIGFFEKLFWSLCSLSSMTSVVFC